MRANHHSLASIGRKAAKHLDFHAVHDSVVKPPIKVKTIQAVRWTNLTPNLERPFKHNGKVTTRKA